ncbi:hypothetical protein [Leisingera caerulea]|uniref:hypothetical protein n=1 Tax=Leisingera caerulea TaxID=506591 RepID=UPI0004840132|nr:hypothetical protein [Leisingera caerulea]
MTKLSPHRQGRAQAEAYGVVTADEEAMFNPWKNGRKAAWNAESYAEEWEKGYRQGVEDNIVRDKAAREAEERARLSKRPYYHVTSPESAENIIEIGFQGGWGDDGFGVYVYDNLPDAYAYAKSGGWDGELTRAVILELQADPDDFDGIIPDPAWPNPEDYETVLVHRMDEDDPMPWEVDVSIIDRSELSQWEGFQGSSLDIPEKAAESAAETPLPG